MTTSEGKNVQVVYAHALLFSHLKKSLENNKQHLSSMDYPILQSQKSLNKVITKKREEYSQKRSSVFREIKLYYDK